MADLVNKQTVLNKLEWNWTRRAAIDAIKNLPPVDAVEVVRCKDCKWFDPTYPCGTIAPGSFRCRLYGAFHVPDFFCFRGERRTDETDLRGRIC